MTAPQDLLAAGKAGVSTFRSTWAATAPRRARVRDHRVGDCRLQLQRRYFVTTDRGVYRIEAGGIYKVLDLPAYGIAADDSYLYLALFLGRRSLLVRGTVMSFLGGGGNPQFEELFSVELASSNERLHALWLGASHLWATNTAHNSLLRVARGDPADQQEFALFSDRFGHRLQYDINHLNGVSEYDGTVLFSAYRAGAQAMIGVFDGVRVTGYGYPNVGIHDIYLMGDHFAFCDTFGQAGSAGGGCVVTSEGVLDAEFFGRGAGYVVRGLAGSAEEMLVGHSHKGDRQKRFEGSGSLLLARHGRVVGQQSIEAAQVYQVMTCEGDFLLPRPAAISPESARQCLSSRLGAPIYEAEVGPATAAKPDLKRSSG